MYLLEMKPITAECFFLNKNNLHLGVIEILTQKSSPLLFLIKLFADIRFSSVILDTLSKPKIFKMFLQVFR